MSNSKPALRIVTCYGCERTFPRSLATVLDGESDDRCPFCGTFIETSLRRGDGKGGDHLAGVVG